MTGALVCDPGSYIAVSLAPHGPLALVWVVPFYGTGRFFGSLGIRLLYMFDHPDRLGITVSEREMRDEVEHGLGLAVGSLYLLFWLLTLLGELAALVGEGTI